MASEPTIDVEGLLRPIGEGSPAGRSLVYEAEYDALREARRSDDDAPQGDWQRNTKAADWHEVVELATDCLTTKTKDLQIAAWLTEALARLHGLAGLRDGLILLRRLVEDYWETAYPEAEDGDLEGRCAPFEFLSGQGLLPLLIRSVPLTDVLGDRRYSTLRYQESREVTNLGKRDAEAMEQAISEGKITAEQFDEAAAMTPRRYCEAIGADLAGTAAAFKELDAAVDARFGRDAPALSNIRKALEDCRRVLDPILAVKRQQEPDEDAGPGPAEEAPVEGGYEAESDAGGYDESPAPTARRSARRPRSPGGPIGSVEDACDRVVEAGAYLRQNDPSNPAGYLVTRALRLGELYGLGRPPDPAGLASPASETRQALKRLAAEGDWNALLEAAEDALARPEGRAWLDAHRHALTAMASCSDADRSAAAGAARAMLRAVLADFPDLPRSELNDDTPAANGETRAWLEAEVAPPAPEPAEPAYVYEPPPEPEPASRGPDGEPAEPDAWEVASEQFRRGRAAEAFTTLRRALAAAQTGRDRFRRKLQLAELCLMAGNLRVAHPLLDELARQVDEFRLEQWEDEELCARVWGALYRCLKGLDAADNGSADRLHHAYTRLCRLDINQALRFGDD